MTELSTYEQILAHLQAQGVPFTIHEHEESRTFQDAKEALPFPLERLLKTVAFRLKTAGWILVAVRGQDRIDYKRLAAALGVKRSEIVQLSADEVRSVLHVEAGSVAPVPTVPNIQVLIDSHVSRTDTLFTGVGRPDRTLEIKLDNLIQVAQGRIAPLIQEPTEVS